MTLAPAGRAVTDVCTHNFERAPEEAHCCMVLLVQQYGLYLLTGVI